MTSPTGIALPDRVVAVGASAGGVEALREFVAHLPADLPACVCIVLHMPANAPSALPGILDRAGPLRAHAAQRSTPLLPGRVVVGVPDHHLLVGPNEIVLGHGPRENGHRPAVDVLFRSAARWWDGRAIGVVLSGSLDDGAAGAHTMAERGGRLLTQNPATAMYSGMPEAVRAVVPGAWCGTPAEMAAEVVRLCREPTPPQGDSVADETLRLETLMAEMDEGAHADPERPGRPAGLACPDCSGAMFELVSGPLVRYRCRVGHAWSAESLLTQQLAATETALWTAIRTLEEKSALHVRLADQDNVTARRMHQQLAADAQGSASVLRDLLRRAERPDRLSSESRTLER